MARRGQVKMDPARRGTADEGGHPKEFWAEAEARAEAAEAAAKARWEQVRNAKLEKLCWEMNPS